MPFDDLKIDVDRLAQRAASMSQRVYEESHEAWHALRRYPRTKALLAKFLREANSHQSRALHLARQLAQEKGRVDALRDQIENAERWGLGDEAAAGLRAQLRDSEALIKAWGWRPGAEDGR